MSIKQYSIQSFAAKGLIPSVVHSNLNPGRAINPLWNFNKTITVKFTSSGTWVCPEGVTEITYLAVAGGGGGGDRHGGGGGGGGYLEGTSNVIPGITYSITVGAGGAEGNYESGGSAGAGLHGSNSTIFSIKSRRS